MALSYAHNLISSANTSLQAMRGDSSIWVSPKDFLGKRKQIRTVPPTSMDLSQVKLATDDLRTISYDREAIIVDLARDTAMRLRECAMQDTKRLISEAALSGKINIIQGTKGGRRVARWIPLSDRTHEILEEAVRIQDNWNCLIPEHMTWRQFKSHLHSVVLPVLRRHGLSTFHDLRSARACQRYQELTHYPAPAVAGYRVAPKEIDKKAREILARELGHGRIDVVGSYVGGQR